MKNCQEYTDQLDSPLLFDKTVFQIVMYKNHSDQCIVPRTNHWTFIDFVTRIDDHLNDICILTENHSVANRPLRLHSEVNSNVYIKDNFLSSRLLLIILLRRLIRF